MTNLAKAILKVMEAVKGIDKTMTVGTGTSSYKGVPDQEVKKIIGEEMKKAGLVLLPISVEPTTTIERWTENGQYGEKQKQQVFTEVKTKYLLLHEKGAGKATTYALKYTMLYSFLVPTGKIDDADATHSDEYEAPKPKQNTADKEWLNIGTPAFEKAKAAIKAGTHTLADVKKKYKVSKATEEQLYV
jgi:hypothetical protein